MNKLVVSIMFLIAVQILNANQLGNQYTLEINSNMWNGQSISNFTYPIPNNPQFTPSIYTTSVAYAERKAEYSNKWYAICFEYDTSCAFVPATYPAGQYHYSAMITVWEIDKCNLRETRTKVCEPFGGQYTEKGCFEDDSIYLIKQAIHIRDQAFTKKLHPDPTPTPTFYQQWEKDSGKKFPYIKNQPTPVPVKPVPPGMYNYYTSNVVYNMSQSIRVRFAGDIPDLDELLENWTYNFGKVKSIEYINGKLIITKAYAAQTGYFYNNKNDMPENVSWKEVYGVKGTNIVLEYFLKSTYIPPVNKSAEFKFEE